MVRKKKLEKENNPISPPNCPFCGKPLNTIDSVGTEKFNWKPTKMTFMRDRKFGDTRVSCANCNNRLPRTFLEGVDFSK